MISKTIMEVDIVNPLCGGIDVGSREHWVCVGQNDATDIRKFGVFTSDHVLIVEFLKERNIQSVAMEATGSFGKTLFSALQAAGFEVILSTSKTIKNPSGKTDKKDCKWIQKLHTLGMLNAAFIPSEGVEELRYYHRHRENLIMHCAQYSNRMQKCLQYLNLRLENVIRDVTGVSGLKIIKAILDGEKDGTKLAELASPNIKKSKEEIAEALVGNWKPEVMYELRDDYNMYIETQNRIKKVDVEIKKVLEIQAIHELREGLKFKKKQKNQPLFDVSSLSYKYFGVDLLAIEGVSHNTVMSIISEVGRDIYKFDNAKCFTSWLRLSPDNKISGGKVLSSKTPKGKNFLAIAFRHAANAIAQCKEGVLKKYFDRVAYRKGRGAAVTSTARKLAIIVWNMINKKQEYKPLDEKNYEEKIKSNTMAQIKKTIKKLNLTQDGITDLMAEFQHIAQNS
jgi:transposase